jgi:hypothetical protein
LRTDQQLGQVAELALTIVPLVEAKSSFDSEPLRVISFVLAVVVSFTAAVVQGFIRLAPGLN